MAGAQFVWPKPEYNQPVPGTYLEDPFIVQYRQKFFSVFRGDFATFNKAYDEIEAMVKKNPKDSRALVWLGNGQTIRAGLWLLQKRTDDAKKLIAQSNQNLDRAVELRPKDPNVYMMRAATIMVQGQYLPESWVPKENWEKLRDDCRRFIKFVGPQRLPKLSIHVRGEAFGEMGLACLKLGDKKGAREAFEKLIALNPGTDYEKRAKKELAALN